MKAKLICYTLGTINHNTRSRFKREFFGYLDKSNSGSYKYPRKGLLSTIPHCKPVRSAIIVEKQNVMKVTQLLKKFNAKIKTYDIMISSKELRIPQLVTH